MSDVWQGPGWWLASDGKWYPADAEPGAVYEGDLPNNDAPAAEAAQPVAAEPPTPIVAQAPAAPPEPAIETTPAVAATPAPASHVDAPAETAAPAPDPFVQMPAPVVEEPKTGGWQSIESEAPAPLAPSAPVQPPPAAPAPVAPVAPVAPATPVVEEAEEIEEVEDDGWTSAYEERQESGGLETLGAPSQPTPPMPVVDPIPVAPIPDAYIPVAPIPDAHIPVAPIPDAHIPDAHIPVAPIPTAPAPIPAVDVPPVDAPVPEVPIEEAPVVEVPPAQIPGAPLAAAGAAAAVALDRDPSVPIERDGAWRKPSAPDETIARPIAPEATGIPDVVDLAIPDEAPPYTPEPAGRNWTLIGGVLVAIAAIVGIAFLIASLLSGDDDSVNTSEPASTTTQTSSSEASAPSTEAEGDDNSVSVFALRAGDCIVGDIGAGQVTKVTKVDCEEEHQFEVYREALIDASITSFNVEAISAYAEEVCRTSLEAYVPADDDRGLKFKFLQPTEDSWNQAEDPDRVITCLLFDDDAPLIGRAA